MKVLLTGATGLIGKEAIIPLEKMGLQVIRLSSENFNLFDLQEMADVIRKHRAEYLLHFAWITGGDYLTNPINKVLCDNSFELLKLFYENGGKKAVLSGTCFEYDFADGILYEDSPLNPKTLYAQKKAELNELCSTYCKKNNLEYAWGRIFYVYGHNEKKGRLTDSIITSILNNERVCVRFGQLERDYMYTKDIVGAFVALLLSSVVGNVNICTGRIISLQDYAKKIAKKLGKEELIEVHTDFTDQPMKIVGSNTRLVNEVGYKIKYDTDSALDAIISYYKGI